MAEFNITTTGLLSTVVIDDLGEKTFIHPLVDFNLLDEFIIEEIRESEDLQAAIDAGYITVTDANSNPITDVNGLGGGDMQKAVYDSDQNNIIDTTSLPAFSGSGTTGIVADPISTSGRFLKDDGTWEVPPSAQGTSVFGFAEITSAGLIVHASNLTVNKTGTGVYEFDFITPAPNSEYVVAANFNGSAANVQDWTAIVTAKNNLGFTITTTSEDNGAVADPPTDLSFELTVIGPFTNVPGSTGLPAGGTTGQVLEKIDGTDYNTQWVTPSTGSGTVTSVGLSMPSGVFDVTNSPITSAGTLTVEFDDQDSGTIFAGPKRVRSLSSTNWATSTGGAFNLPEVQGDNRLLIFTIGAEDPSSIAQPTDITYGGQSLTRVTGVEATENSPSYERSELWILNEAGINAAVGDALVVTWISTPDDVMYSASFYENVDQTTPISSSTTQTVGVNDDITPPALSVNPGDIYIYTVSCGNLGDYSLLTGYVENADITSGSTATTSVATKQILTAGTEQPTITFNTGANRQSMTCAVINAIEGKPSFRRLEEEDLPDKMFFHATDIIGGRTFTPSVFSDAIFDTTVVEEGFTFDGTELTFNSNGWFKVTYDVICAQAGGNSRSEARTKLQLDIGGGFDDIPGTLGSMYSRQAAQGETSVSKTVIRFFNEGDIIKLVGTRESGSGNLETLPNSTNLTVEKI